MNILKMGLLLVFSFGLTFFSESCLKDPFAPPRELPPFSCDGKETFGCLVNGEKFFYNGFNSIQFEYDFKGTYGGNFSFLAKRHDHQDGMHVDLEHQVWDTGYYKLGFDDVKIGAVSYFNHKDTPLWYDCRSHMFGELYISGIDTVKGIICGTFSFDAVEMKNDLDTVRIRDARFDMPF